MKYINSVFISIALLFCACETNVPLHDLDLHVEPNLSVYGYIFEGNFLVGVRYTQSIANQNQFISIGNAEIRLYKNGVWLKNLDIIKTTNYTYTEKYVGGVFVTDSTVLSYNYTAISDLISNGDSYQFHVKVPGFDTLYAPTYIPEKSMVKVISGKHLFSDQQENHYSLTFEVDDNEKESNYYRFGLSGQAHEFSGSNLKFTYPGCTNSGDTWYSFSDRSLNDGNFTIELIEQRHSGRVEKGNIVFYQMDSTSYFAKATSEAMERMQQTDELYAFEPINTYSNVINGHGHIEGVGVKTYDTINLIELFPNVQ